MGLDWLPGNKPKPGFEREFEQVFRRANELDGGAERDALLARFMEISLPAYESLGAPQVGRSEAADRWAKELYVENQPDMTEEQFLQELQDYYVLDLVPDCDGLPRYSNAPFGYVEAYSFRAEFLTDCIEIIGERLLESAYRNMTATELRDYAQNLIESAESYARRQGLDINGLNAEDPESDEARLDVVVAAARWCQFWAERGHLLNVDW